MGPAKARPHARDDVLDRGQIVLISGQQLAVQSYPLGEHQRDFHRHAVEPVIRAVAAPGNRRIGRAHKVGVVAW